MNKSLYRVAPSQKSVTVATAGSETEIAERSWTRHKRSGLRDWQVTTRQIAISITEGRAVRDLFYNGLLEQLGNGGWSIIVFTEATKVPAFIKKWQKPQVEFAELLPVDVHRRRYYALKLRGLLKQWKADFLLRQYMEIERKCLYPPRQEYVELFRQQRPGLVVATNPLVPDEAELIHTAKALRIPTLGVVRSWDNVCKGLQIHTDHVAVWNPINRQEVIELERYSGTNIAVLGAPQFDPYFTPQGIWSREKLAAHFHLDPRRPIILYATMGYFAAGLDETCWMEMLLDQIDHGNIAGKPQVICRLHPLSRLEHFRRYANHPDVRLSFVDRYLPTLTWYMTREDVVLVGNIVRHADAVITPGTTITLEAAIFDRPTVVPIFHSYQPEIARAYFQSRMLDRHFRRLEELNLVPIIRSLEDFAPAINRCLRDPKWYQDQRTQLVRDYVHFTDGRSVRRLADLIGQLAKL
jgi:hypothetical protein